MPEDTMRVNILDQKKLPRKPARRQPRLKGTELSPGPAELPSWFARRMLRFEYAEPMKEPSAAPAPKPAAKKEQVTDG